KPEVIELNLNYAVRRILAPASSLRSAFSIFFKTSFFLNAIEAFILLGFKQYCSACRTKLGQCVERWFEGNNFTLCLKIFIWTKKFRGWPTSIETNDLKKQWLTAIT
ncbi:hypothetical protein HZS_658, partial [Henneguya salminicola]